ncbi:ribonuclease H-like domain-containing protein [Mycena galericulata]|nr:ribonuclease H-like domain-containing protein [Mycena galericulata]
MAANAVLPFYPRTSTFHYITDPAVAAAILQLVIAGRIGFNTEFVPRVVPQQELDVGTWPQRLAYQRNHVAQYGVAGIPVDWDGMGLCIIQIALDHDVYIINLKAMHVIPNHLKRIVESPTILKVGAGLITDGRVFWEDLGWSPRSFVDIGLMIRLANPIPYATMAGSVSLETCVADVLGFQLDKELGLSQWDRPLDPNGREIEYAGLDAQASLDVYNTLAAPMGPLRTQELRLNRLIPNDWYTFHYIDGAPTRIVQNYLGNNCPWSYQVCLWYVSGVFSAYHV